jgi:hypothetical protein
VVREIWLHVEGGGNSTQKEQLRQGFGAFLGGLQDRARARGIRVRVTFWGPRSETYVSFMRSLRQTPATLHLLLVDSEGPVTSAPRHHLTITDAWNLAGISDEQCHLMIEVMESWFLADPGVLENYFGQGFSVDALPPTRDVEQVAKDTVLEKLNRAARATKKQRYDKGRDTHLILARLDAGKVRSRAQHCDRLFATIEQQIADGNT